ARERIGGLQGLAAVPAPSRATLLGRRGDRASREIHSFLTRNQIRFDWLNPESDEASRWPGPTVRAMDLPALHCGDGTTRLRARPRQVAERLGLRTLPLGTEYDTGHRRWRPRRARRRGVRRFRGATDLGHRARGTGWTGRDLLPHRELSWLSH